MGHFFPVVSPGIVEPFLLLSSHMFQTFEEGVRSSVKLLGIAHLVHGEPSLKQVSSARGQPDTLFDTGLSLVKCAMSI
jgi:hypothetical protein